MNMRNIFGKFEGDKIIWIIAACLGIFSMIVIYSAASGLSNDLAKQNFLFYFRSHGFNLLLGFILIYIVHLFDYRWFGRISRIGFVFAIILLVATIAFGHESNEAKRELFGIQTFYIVEFFVIIFLAQIIAKWGNEINDIKHKFLPLLGAILLVSVLIMTQNVSTSIILLITSFVLLFISPLKKKIFFTTLVILLLFGGLFISTNGFGIPGFNRFETVKNRVERFFDAKETDIEKYVKTVNPDNIRQEILAEGAIATGGIMPVNGPGNSIFNSYLPQCYSDYIFAITVEEYGAIIGIVLIFFYLIIFYRVFKIIRYTKSVFGVYLAVGLGFLIVFQALIHVLVNIGLFPSTGQTLPMFSWGGMSIIVTSICFGVILSISKEAKREKKLKINQHTTIE
ncbi:MAG: FtsW/RodA/SpoVE family cell cycle protein [Bacteroidales bacterium]|nr:FtsW/RodA/SpoVE family cell cycle protein [Bacteroidales bacterium]